jgi:hypothetical protein
MTEIIVRSLDITKDPIAIMPWPDTWPVPGPGEGITVTSGIYKNSCAPLTEFEIVKRVFVPLTDNPQIEVYVREPFKDLLLERQNREKSNRFPYRRRSNSMA